MLSHGKQHPPRRHHAHHHQEPPPRSSSPPPKLCSTHDQPAADAEPPHPDTRQAAPGKDTPPTVRQYNIFTVARLDALDGKTIYFFYRRSPRPPRPPRTRPPSMSSPPTPRTRQTRHFTAVMEWKRPLEKLFTIGTKRIFHFPLLERRFFTAVKEWKNPTKQPLFEISKNQLRIIVVIRNSRQPQQPTHAPPF